MPTARETIYAHQRRVAALMIDFACRLLQRAAIHDDSKHTPEELGPLEAMHRLIETDGPAPFGSDAYRARTDMLRPMLGFHYARNSHHPEHHPNGVEDMDLLDLVEMLLDWKAASERDGSTTMNLSAAAERFHLEPQMRKVFETTARNLGFEVT